MKRNAIRMSRDDRVFYGLVYGVIAILCIIVAYPLIYILSSSFSSGAAVSGGMIPNYLLMRDLHLLNTARSLLLPGAIGVSQMIVARTFIQSNLPDELLEATQIDGCSDFRFFGAFVLPLSKAVIAVIAMQYAIAEWNAYFNAFLYLTDQSKYPLQIFLREILIMNTITAADVADAESLEAMQGMSDLLKYSLIVVSTVPILLVYPFIHKYFVQGVMIGSLKG